MHGTLRVNVILVTVGNAGKIWINLYVKNKNWEQTLKNSKEVLFFLVGQPISYLY